MIIINKKIWDTLAWIAFAIIVTYLLLKLLGIIHSPLTVDLIALISGAYFVGRYAKKIDDTFDDVGKVKKDLRKLNEKCPVLEKKS